MVSKWIACYYGELIQVRDGVQYFSRALWSGRISGFGEIDLKQFLPDSIAQRPNLM